MVQDDSLLIQPTFHSEYECHTNAVAFCLTEKYLKEQKRFKTLGQDLPS